MDWLKFLEGKRTYVVAILMLVANGLFAFGVVDAETIHKIDLLLAPIGLAFLRAGVPPKA